MGPTDRDGKADAKMGIIIKAGLNMNQNVKIHIYYEDWS